MERPNARTPIVCLSAVPSSGKLYISAYDYPALPVRAGNIASSPQCALPVVVRLIIPVYGELPLDRIFNGRLTICI